MVKETTIICIDTSDYMGHHDSLKYLAQLDALQLYLQLIIKPHSDHYVGVYGLAGYSRCLIVEPTNDISDIMTIVRRSQICMQGPHIYIIRVLSEIMCDHEEDVLTRMVVFIGGSLLDRHYDSRTYRLGKYSSHRFTVPWYTALGTRIKERGVALDIINFGTQQQGFKKHTLCVILDAANNNGNARMLDRSGHDDLDASSFLALVGTGQTGLESVLLMQGDDFQTFINHYKNDFDKENQDDKGPDEDGNRGDRYDQKQDDKGPDEGGEIGGDQGDRLDQKQDDTTSRCFRIRLSVDTSSNSSILEASGHDEGMKRHRNRGYGHGQRQDDNMLRVGKDIGIEVMGMAGNKIMEVTMKDMEYIGIEVIGMAPARPASPAYDGCYYYPPYVAPVSHMQMGTSFAPHQPVYGPQTTSYQSQQPYFQSNIPQYGQQMHPGQPQQMMYMPAYPPEMPYQGRGSHSFAS